MTVPTNMVYKDGMWWSPDGSGPYFINSTGNPLYAGDVVKQGAGQFTQQNRQAAQPIWQYVDVAASANAVVTGACLFGGATSLTAGTTASVFDALTQVAPTLINAQSIAAVGNFLSPFGTGQTGGPIAGIVCATGLSVTLAAGGSIRLWYAPQVS